MDYQAEQHLGALKLKQSYKGILGWLTKRFGCCCRFCHKGWPLGVQRLRGAGGGAAGSGPHILSAPESQGNQAFSLKWFSTWLVLRDFSRLAGSIKSWSNRCDQQTVLDDQFYLLQLILLHVCMYAIFIEHSMQPEPMNGEFVMEKGHMNRRIEGPLFALMHPWWLLQVQLL